jgi:hypothetical protein
MSGSGARVSGGPPNPSIALDLQRALRIEELLTKPNAKTLAACVPSKQPRTGIDGYIGTMIE